jgi:hypothetical protein
MKPAPGPAPAGKVTVWGLQPWLPWPLGRWRWWTEPVRAERLAALRIGLAAVLLVDLLATYLPQAGDFFGGDLGRPGLFARWSRPPSWRWSLLDGGAPPWVLRAALVVWVLATVSLLLGLSSRLSAGVVWLLSTSFGALNPVILNAGDAVRGIVLLYLVLSPCGAAWSLDAWWRRRRQPDAGPAWVYPWPLRLLFVQMVLIYFCNGLYKLFGPDWWSGRALYYVLADLTISRWSYAQVPVPFWLTQLLTWTVLAWEVTFPLLLCWRPARLAALGFGVLFHLTLAASVELGAFSFYMLCLYLPLVPWERWRPKSRNTP